MEEIAFAPFLLSKKVFLPKIHAIIIGNPILERLTERALLENTDEKRVRRNPSSKCSIVFY
jgi:hypothetical protein